MQQDTHIEDPELQRILAITGGHDALAWLRRQIDLSRGGHGSLED